MNAPLPNDLVAAARALLRFRPGNEGPDGWTQFAGSDDETSEDSTDAIRYRFLRDRLVAQGPITYYHMPRALMFLRDETRGTFDTAVDARMKGVEHEPHETEARLPVEVQLQTEKELHAAWRKRAEEAEATLELIRNPPAVDSHGKCRHCGYYNMHGLGCQAADSAVKTSVTPSASTDDNAPPSRPPSSSVECPKCRTQLAFEGDECGLCKEDES